MATNVTNTLCASSDDTSAMVENAARIAIVRIVESVPSNVLRRGDVSTNFCMLIQRREMRAVPVPSVRRSYITDLLGNLATVRCSDWLNSPDRRNGASLHKPTRICYMAALPTGAVMAELVDALP